MPLQPHLNLTSAIILFGIAQALLLAVIFLRKGSKSSTLFLGLMMMVLAVIEVESFLNASGYMVYVPHLLNISPPLIFLLGPFVFFYASKVTEPQKRFGNYFIHLVPALLYGIYSFFFYLQSSSFKISAFMRSHYPQQAIGRVAPDFPIDPLNIQGWVVIEGLSIHLLIYVILSLRRVLQSHDPVALLSRNHERNLGWAKFLCFNLLCGSIVFLLTGGVVNGRVIFHNPLPPYLADVYCTFLVYTISAFWLSRAIPSEESSKKYAKSELPPAVRQQKLKLVKEIMEQEKPYKDINFSLEQLARKSSLSTHHLSQVINVELGMTFVEFVNLCRISEAQKILSMPDQKDIKVEILAHELGYQSKSAFFNAFRKHTDTTPARFRALQ